VVAAASGQPIRGGSDGGGGGRRIRSLMAYLQMNWQPNLLSHKRKTGPPLGLKNLGNTCYINSVLQCLTYTPPLAYFCLKSQHSASCNSSTFYYNFTHLAYVILFLLRTWANPPPPLFFNTEILRCPIGDE